jgi:hypothetical protein
MTEEPQAADSVESAIDAMTMQGIIGDGGTLASSWVLIVDVEDQVRMYVDRHSKGYQTVGLTELAKEMITRAEFAEDEY